jgi:hypothetical protein
MMLVAQEAQAQTAETEAAAAADAKASIYGEKPAPKLAPERPGVFGKMHAFVEKSARPASMMRWLTHVCFAGIRVRIASASKRLPSG